MGSRFEVGLLDDVKLVVAMNEKTAAFGLPTLDGRPDYSRGFVGDTPGFHGWCRDLVFTTGKSHSRNILRFETNKMFGGGLLNLQAQIGDGFRIESESGGALEPLPTEGNQPNKLNSYLFRRSRSNHALKLWTTMTQSSASARSRKRLKTQGMRTTRSAMTMRCADCNCTPQECKTAKSGRECAHCTLEVCCCWQGSSPALSRTSGSISAGRRLGEFLGQGRYLVRISPYIPLSACPG